MPSITIHGIKTIKLSAVGQLDSKSKSFVRDIVLEGVDDNLRITAFADEEKNLQIEVERIEKV